MWMQGGEEVERVYERFLLRKVTAPGSGLLLYLPEITGYMLSQECAAVRPHGGWLFEKTGSAMVPTATPSREQKMYLRTMSAALSRCETEHRFWHGAQIVCTQDGKVRMQTLWRNPELAGIWQLSYALSGACLDSLLRHRHFVLEQETADGAQVYRFVK